MSGCTASGFDGAAIFEAATGLHDFVVMLLGPHPYATEGSAETAAEIQLIRIRRAAE